MAQSTASGTSKTPALILTTGLMGRVAAGASERIRLGVIGINGRGWNHITHAHSVEALEVAALCDVDQQRLEAVGAETKNLTGTAPRLYRDMREMFQDPGIDAVSIATPNHWHTLAALWAMQAGKHVYVEKPLSHTFEEGRRLAEAAKAGGVVVQHGTQRRSDPHWIELAKAARKGIIGDIYMARCICFQPRPLVEDAPEETPPPHFDWNLWQGPATARPFSRKYVHYNWHWFWHYGNGEVGNNLVHFTDVANWILQKGLPVEVFSEGRRFGEKDAGETPNTQVMINRFADGALLVNEVRNRFSNQEELTSTGLFLYGSEGYMANGKFHDKHGRVIDSFQAPGPREATRDHLLNFVTAIRKNQPEKVSASPEDGHVAAALCHLGNIAHRIGRNLKFDPAQGRFVDSEEANTLLTREYREGFALPV